MPRTAFFRASLLFLGGISVSTVLSMPRAHPDAIEYMKSQGTFESFIERSQAREADEWRPARFRMDDLDEEGIRSLVFLVDFPDQEADVEKYPPSHYEELLFSVGTHPTGSARDFYTDNSYGGFDFTGDVTVKWFRAPHPMAGYYCNADGIPGTADDHGMGGGDKSVAGLIRDVVELSDPEIDFSLYDNDNDGYIESVFFVHAGPGAESSGNPDHIWSHRSWVVVPTQDGVTVSDYTTEPESGTIGVFVHEFGHVMGIPDLYDTDYSSSGVGDWSVMASGSWLPNGQGTTPANFDAWTKVTLGFVDPVVITQNDLLNNPFEIPRVADNPVIYKLTTENNPRWEYFLVENRQQVLNDRHIPGDGLLIWHIDEARTSNAREGEGPKNDGPHYLVTVEEANCLSHGWPFWDDDQVPGSFQLERQSYYNGDPGDPFPGRNNVRQFHGSTWPNSHAYLGGDSDSKVAVLDISDSGDIMTATFDVTRAIPVLQVSRTHVLDEASGDGDGRGESGETVDLVLDVLNVWGKAPGVTAVLSSDSPEVSILDANGTFGLIGEDIEKDNTQDPFVLEIGAPGGSTEEAKLVPFEVEFSSTPMGQPFTVTVEFELLIGWPDVIVVDDDGGDELEITLHEDLAAAGIEVFDQWNTETASGTVVDPFDTGNRAMIWITGDEKTETLTEADRTALGAKLDAGMNFILSGQNFDEEIGETDFFRDYLHLAVDQYNSAQAVAQGDGANAVLGCTPLMVIVQGSPSSFTPLGGAEAGLIYNPSNAVAAVTYDGNPSAPTHKVATFGFDVGLIQSAADRRSVLSSCLDWICLTGMEGEAPPVPESLRVELERNVPNPFNPVTSIGFYLPRSTYVALRVYDLTGALVRTLLEGELAAGRHQAQWDGHSGHGQPMASGVYLYRLETGEAAVTRKMLLIK